MSTTTTSLSLIKMEQGEYINSWGDIVNDNLDKLDTAVGTLQALTLDAAGLSGTIDARLDLIDHPSTGSVTTLAKMLVLGENFYAFQGGPAPGPDYNYYGSTHAADGMDASARNVGVIGREMDELRCSLMSRDWDAVTHGTNVASNSTINGRTSGSLGLMLSKASGSGLLTAGDGNPTGALVGWMARTHADKVTVGQGNINEDVLISCRGRLGVIRNGGAAAARQVTLPGSPASKVYHVVATDVIDYNDAAWDQTDGSIDFANKSRLVSAAMGGLEAARGDILRVKAPQSNAANGNLEGEYLITDIAVGHVDIMGEFYDVDTGGHSGIEFTFARKKWPVLDFLEDVNLSFQGADAYGSADGLFKGTALGSITTDGAGALQSGTPNAGGLVINAFGDRYDSGWQSLATPGFFQGGANAFQNGDPIYRVLPFPTIPSTIEVWIGLSAAPTGSNATRAQAFLDATSKGISVSIQAIGTGGATIERAPMIALHALDTTDTHMQWDGAMVTATVLAADYSVRIIARR